MWTMLKNGVKNLAKTVVRHPIISAMFCWAICETAYPESNKPGDGFSVHIGPADKHTTKEVLDCGDCIEVEETENDSAE